MTKLAALLTFSAFALGACVSNPADAPAGFETGPTLSAGVTRSDFSPTEQMLVATHACVASELSGPEALRQLEDEGYTYINVALGERGYTRLSETSVGIFNQPLVINVHDNSNRTDCMIRVNRGLGAEFLGLVEISMAALGYRKIEMGRFERFVGNGERFSVTGTRSLNDALATISIGHMTPETDPTCRNMSLPDALREGCGA